MFLSFHSSFGPRRRPGRKRPLRGRQPSLCPCRRFREQTGLSFPEPPSVTIPCLQSTGFICLQPVGLSAGFGIPAIKTANNRLQRPSPSFRRHRGLPLICTPQPGNRYSAGCNRIPAIYHKGPHNSHTSGILRKQPLAAFPGAVPLARASFHILPPQPNTSIRSARKTGLELLLRPQATAYGAIGPHPPAPSLLRYCAHKTYVIATSRSADCFRSSRLHIFQADIDHYKSAAAPLAPPSP